MDLQLINNDLYFENNNLSTITGIEETAQNIVINMKTFLGEWFLNQTIGVAYFSDIFVKNFSLNNVETVLLNAIINTSGVLNVLEFNVEYNTNRSITVNTKIQSEEGDIVLNDILLP